MAQIFFGILKTEYIDLKTGCYKLGVELFLLVNYLLVRFFPKRINITFGEYFLFICLGSFITKWQWPLSSVNLGMMFNIKFYEHFDLLSQGPNGITYKIPNSRVTK